MIRAIFYRGDDGAIVAFHLSGHAHQGPYGEDILCSAVSALSQATIIGLEEVVGLAVTVEQQSGLLHCTLPSTLTRQQQTGAAVLLETLRLSLSSLQQDYSDALYLETAASQGGGMDAGH